MPKTRKQVRAYTPWTVGQAPKWDAKILKRVDAESVASVRDELQRCIDAGRAVAAYIGAHPAGSMWDAVKESFDYSDADRKIVPGANGKRSQTTYPAPYYRTRLRTLVAGATEKTMQTLNLHSLDALPLDVVGQLVRKVWDTRVTPAQATTPKTAEQQAESAVKGRAKAIAALAVAGDDIQRTNDIAATLISYRATNIGLTLARAERIVRDALNMFRKSIKGAARPIDPAKTPAQRTTIAGKLAAKETLIDATA